MVRLIGIVWAFCLILAAGAVAEVRNIMWDDLLPRAYFEAEKKADALQVRLEAMTPEAQDAFSQIISKRRLAKAIADGVITAEELAEGQQILLQSDAGVAHPDATKLVDEVEALTAEIENLDRVANSDLDGARIKMPGYVLPLEYDGAKVTEFLLVPFVGACIHVPPPPANQMVHVLSKEGFESDGLYMPVYVTGRMTTVAAQFETFMKDGDVAVETGYRMEDVSIEPYTE